jgi:hypothetical protein
MQKWKCADFVAKNPYTKSTFSESLGRKEASAKKPNNVFQFWYSKILTLISPTVGCIEPKFFERFQRMMSFQNPSAQIAVTALIM